MVGVKGFEPPTFWSQTRRATKLRYTPIKLRAVSQLRLNNIQYINVVVNKIYKLFINFFSY